MALGDGIRRNIKDVEPAERALLIDAMKKINSRYFMGTRTDTPPGGVTWWFKQDETHQGTHVHGGPEFIPWHREIVNRFEELLREIHPELSLHYWDWTEDPRDLQNANLGGGTTGPLNLFTVDLFGYGGSSTAEVGEPWKSAGFYNPAAANKRDDTGNPADPPEFVNRSIDGSPASASDDTDILAQADYHDMRTVLEPVHDAMHGFVRMGGQHISFRDPFVFLLHSNVDRLFARWQTDPGHPERLTSAGVYGSETALLNVNLEPWSGGINIRPWASPEHQEDPKTYKHFSVVTPPCYDTNHTQVARVETTNPGTPPVINFNNVPTGTTTVRAASFRVYGCGNATVRVKAGGAPAAPFSVLHPASGSVTVPHVLSAYAEVRIWIAYLAGPAGVPVPDGSVTIECPESGQEFMFKLKANSIAKETVAVMLALDQSGSMNDAAGTSGQIRINVLKDAAKRFMEIIGPNDGVGLIRFDHDAYAFNHGTYPGMAIKKVLSTDMFDGTRVEGIAAVNAHATNLAGNTSVGDGVALARQMLNNLPMNAYTNKAIIVFTDGLENSPLSIADVTGSIDSRTFPVGLGNELQVDTGALRALAHSTNGYLLLTGLLSGSIDDYFRTSKYFLQILAGVTNNDIILDPNGYISTGMTVAIPFLVTEADIQCTAILMADYQVIDMRIKTPNGDIIDPLNAGGLAISYQAGDKTKNYRFNLPVAFASGNHAGTWYVLLNINEGDYKKALAGFNNPTHGFNEGSSAQSTLNTHGAKYSVVINTWSNLKFKARIDQDSMEPGATVTLHANLSEYDMPVEGRADVNVEVRRPDGTMHVIPLQDIGDGAYENAFVANLSGIYYCRFIATGSTLRGKPFTREMTLNAAVYQGGNRPPVRGSDLPTGGNNPTIVKDDNKCCTTLVRVMWVMVVLLLLILIAILRNS